jgi:hydrogenase maturation factor HypF (carbamoyltransferase family)
LKSKARKKRNGVSLRVSEAGVASGDIRRHQNKLGRSRQNLANPETRVTAWIQYFRTVFDAVAAIAGVRLCASYEGQGAMEMEALARRAALPVDDAYPFDAGDGILDFRETIRSVARGR